MKYFCSCKFMKNIDFLIKKMYNNKYDSKYDEVI